MNDTLEGIPKEKAIEHRESCEFCQGQLVKGTAEAKFKVVRHIVRFFNGPKDFLEPCSQ